MQYQFQMPIWIKIKCWIWSLAVNTLFGYVRMNDRGTGVMQIRLSSCACIILFSVLFQGQVVTIADQHSSHTGPIKLKKTGVLMCTKHHRNGFISGTSKRIKFVENVFCSQIFKHTLCGNILIVFSCVFLVLDRSSSAVHSLTVSPLICSFTHFDQMQQIPGAAHFLYWSCHLE